MLRVIQEQEPNRLENPQMYSESLLIFPSLYCPLLKIRRTEKNPEYHFPKFSITIQKKLKQNVYRSPVRGPGQSKHLQMPAALS